MGQQFKSDYDYIVNNDVAGLLKKHNSYINHYAKTHKHYQEFSDSKQDLIIEVLELLEWVDKKKIDKNFSFRYFMFQKFNAYRKSKPTRNKKITQKLEILITSEGDISRSGNSYYLFEILKDSRQNIELDFYIEKEFPSSLNRLEQQIYFRNMISNEKPQAIISELKLKDHNEFNRIRNNIRENLVNYLNN